MAPQRSTTLQRGLYFLPLSLKISNYQEHESNSPSSRSTPAGSSSSHLIRIDNPSWRPSYRAHWQRRARIIVSRCLTPAARSKQERSPFQLALPLAALFSSATKGARGILGEKRWRADPGCQDHSRPRARGSVIGILNARRSAGIFHGVLSPDTLYFSSSSSFLSLLLSRPSSRRFPTPSARRVHAPFVARTRVSAFNSPRGEGSQTALKRRALPPSRLDRVKIFLSRPRPSNIARLSTLFQWINSPLLPPYHPERIKEYLASARCLSSASLAVVSLSARRKRAAKGVCTQLLCTCCCMRTLALVTFVNKRSPSRPDASTRSRYVSVHRETTNLLVGDARMDRRELFAAFGAIIRSCPNH